MLPYIFYQTDSDEMTVYPCRSLTHSTHWLVVTKSPFFRLFRRRPGFDKGLEPFSKSIELQHDKGDYFEIRHRRKWTLSQVCAASSAVSEVDLIPAWVWIRPPFTPTLDIGGWAPQPFFTRSTFIWLALAVSYGTKELIILNVIKSDQMSL